MLNIKISLTSRRPRDVGHTRQMCCATGSAHLGVEDIKRALTSPLLTFDATQRAFGAF